MTSSLNITLELQGIKIFSYWGGGGGRDNFQQLVIHYVVMISTSTTSPLTCTSPFLSACREFLQSPFLEQVMKACNDMTSLSWVKLHRTSHLRGEGFSEIFVESSVHLLVLQFVPLGQTSSQVDHGLYGHPSLYPFITTVQLGVSLLYQSNPELIFIRAASVAVMLVFLW